jgi:hypothetical protein
LEVIIATEGVPSLAASGYFPVIEQQATIITTKRRTKNNTSKANHLCLVERKTAVRFY